MSALTRMANGEDKSVVITDSDVVAISSQPIPGNEKAVSISVTPLLPIAAIRLRSMPSPSTGV